MNDDDVNKLTDDAFRIIQETISGKRKPDPQFSAACEFVRTIQNYSWLVREERRRAEKGANEWPDRVFDSRGGKGGDV